MSRALSLSNKLLAVSLGFLLAALACVGVALWLGAQLGAGAAAMEQAARLQAAVTERAQTVGADSAEVPDAAQRFGAVLAMLGGDGPLARIVARDADLRARTARLRADWDRAGRAAPEPVALASLRAVLQAASAAWAHRVEAYARWLRWLLLAFGVLAVVAASTFLFLGHLFVLEPVRRLRRAFAAVRAGQLATRMDLRTHDEFGQLAAGFNLMTRALQTARTDLEHKVREKTAGVEERNQRLAALYAMSALAAGATDLQALTRGFITQVRRAAGCDGALVRWADESNAYYTLLAADGVPQALVEHEQSLPTGSCRCGQVQADARLRVFPVDAGAGQRAPYCAHLGFRTVVSVPVELHERVLGEITLFYRARTALPDATRELLVTLGSHLAVAMENLRVAALEREAAITAERKLIARELHDSIAQSLTFLKIQAQLLRGALAQGDAAARERSLGELDVGIRECLADVRELLVHFRARTQDEDIEGALRATLSKFEHQTHIATALSMRGHGAPLAADVQIQVLHVVQEALSNVRKHAGARRVELTVQRHPRWRFEVRDDGAGFDAATRDGAGVHVGLDIMRERAQRIDARLEVTSTPGAGTCVALELPQRTPPPAPRQAPRITVAAS